MADSKISGLSLVAAFATTQEFAVNDSGTSRKITGAQLIAALPQGTLPNGYVSINANVGPFTAQADVTGLTITVTPSAAGRRWRLSCSVGINSTVLTDVNRILLMEGATQLALTDSADPGTTGAIPAVYLSVILQPTFAAHTYKVQASRAAGSGTVNVFASSTQLSWILCEDIGV